jgi:hypothetical protein
MNPSRARATDPSNGWSRVCAENLQFLNLLGPDYFVGFFYVVDGELRDVVEAVLNDTDVNELRGIGDNSLEDPVRLHVGELSDASLNVGAATLSPRGVRACGSSSRMLARVKVTAKSFDWSMPAPGAGWR